MLSECSKFIPNIFNPSKCSNCFKLREEHNGVSPGDHAINKKAIKCGYLFIAPRDWDFTTAIQKSKRWQRRWFVLYDDGELTWSLDEQPDTIPQGTLDMKNVVEVSSAESITDNQYSLVLRTTTKGGAVFVKGVSNEEIRTWELKFKRVLASSIVPVIANSANLGSSHHLSGPSTPPPISTTISSHTSPNNNLTASINLANKRRMTIGGTVPPQLSAPYESNKCGSTTNITGNGNSSNTSNNTGSGSSTGSNSTTGSTISISGSTSSSHSHSTSSLRSSRFHSDVSLMSPRGDPDGCGEKSVDHGPLRKGWLLKFGQEESCWCKYWFVLRNSKLLYFTNADEEECIDSQGLDLSTKIVSVESTRHYGFNVNDWSLAAITNGMRGIWIKFIEAAKLSPSSESLEGQETPPQKQSPMHHHHHQPHQQISSIVTAASPTGTLPPSLPSSPPATATSPTTPTSSTTSSVVLSPLLKSKKSLKWRKKAVMELKEQMDKYGNLPSGHGTNSGTISANSINNSSSANTTAMTIQDTQAIDEIMYLKSSVRKLETDMEALGQERMILSLRLNDFTEKLYQSEKSNKQLRLKMNRVKGQSLKDKQVEIELLNKISILEDEIKNYSFNQTDQNNGPCEKCAILEEQVKEREVKLGELESCIQEMEIQFNKKLHELRDFIAIPNEGVVEHNDLRVKYQREIEELKNLCSKGLEALENSHRRMISELEEKHRRETQSLRIEKEAALQEETNATLAALDVLRKNHEIELQREMTRFKDEFIRKFQDGQDLTALHKEHEEELAEIKNEILLLSDKYSSKCLEAAQLEETIVNLNSLLVDAKRRIIELEGAGFLGVVCYNLENNNDNRDPESHFSDCSGHVRKSFLRSTSYQQLAQPAQQL